MYNAKRGGRGHAFYAAEDDRSSLRRLSLVGELKGALDRDELVLHYQPMVDPSTGGIQTIEALVRWNRGGAGLVPPGEFIPVAEDSGLIVGIGAWVLRTACADLARLRSIGEIGDEVRVSVNLSPVQLMDAGVVDAVAGALRSSGLPARCLWLEVTESAVMADLGQALQTMNRLKALGVTLAMDDFGTGQSSLSHIARMLPVDVLKLDRSFVQAIENPRERAIVAAVAALGEALGLITVAEGIESAEVAADLAEIGYDLGQGFHWFRPAPLDALRVSLLADSVGLGVR
jgi:EAL domain-containing protein (putative c-di-GMP-specific phosphodiesterase class I)